jgi:PAS domain S-box-containing protein
MFRDNNNGASVPPRKPYEWRLAAGRLVIYGLAVLAVIGALLARLALGFEADDPLLGLFLIPIMLSAYVGGLGPGLVATAFSAVCATYFVAPPDNPFSLGERLLSAEWGLLLVTGLLICVLNEALHRARRRAEADRLLQSVTLASVGDALITTDMQGRVTFLNGEAERLTGWSSASAVGQPLPAVFQIINRETRAAVEDPVAKVLRTGGVAGLANHTVLIARDGRETPIDDSGAPIRGEGGRMLGVVLVFRNIAERERAESELRASEERFRLIVEGAHDYALFMLDPAGQVSSWNTGAARLKGFVAEEIVGQHFACFYTAEDQLNGLPARLLAAAEASGHVEDEGWRVRKDGSRFWASVAITALRDDAGQLRGFSKLIRDLTERRRADQALRAERDRFFKLAETVPGVVHAFRLRPDGTSDFPYASPRIVDLYGLTPEALAQDASGLSAYWHPEDVEWLYASFERSQRELAAWRAEFRVINPARGQIWVEGHSIPVQEADGSVIWYGVLTDITERKQAEQAMERSADRLRVLADASRAFAEAGGDRQVLLDRMARIFAERLRAACTIRLISDDGEWLDIAALGHYDPAELVNMRDSIGSWRIRLSDSIPAAITARTGQTQFVPVIDRDALSASLDPERRGLLETFLPHSLIATPLQLSGQSLGSLMLARNSGDLSVFDADDLSLAQDLTDRAALAIANARLLQQVQHELAERASAEATARERERKLSTLLDLLPVGISILDSERHVSYSNPALKRIAQLSDAALVDHSYTKRRYIDSAGNLLQPEQFASARAMRENRPVENVETGIAEESGRVIWTNVSAVPVDFPDWKAVIVTSDITAQKQAERALLRSNRRLQVLADAARAFAEVVRDYQALLDRVTRTSAEVLGDSCTIRLISDDGETLPVVALYDSDPEKLAIQRIVLGETALRIDELSISTLILQTQQPRLMPVVDLDQMRAATKPEFWSLLDQLGIHSMMIVPMRVQGRAVGILGLYRHGPGQPPFDDDDLALAQDLADRAALAIANARLRDEIARHAENLELRVAARTAELTAANKELEAFSYSVSHDLRAPLRAIDGFSRILQEDYIAGLPEEARNYFQFIRDNAQQMGRLVDDLLTFSRLGRQPLRKQAVGCDELVRQCLDELRDEQAGRQIELTIGDLPIYEGDPALLKQVWLNLLANALKYTRRRAVARIEIGSYADQGETICYIKDNGAGFDMRYADKLFGVFQRLHRAEEYEGTGVGLAIVARIINRHGGRVWADAKIDQGATFFLTLEGTYS